MLTNQLLKEDERIEAATLLTEIFRLQDVNVIKARLNHLASLLNIPIEEVRLYARDTLYSGTPR